ncbi:PREDICTED: uncharacterized protein LOC106749762 [Dinoponera quadriceps]|uniref:Uncharacterized protein LOC106749762 n=1 Tax=Dinoponera quadriceps TaxID=609295 RepID=A0A6P3Y2D6_DINQU|nr:PREDICTED: uncharacterized protein LOC106749762 [Dinoponera quadriceps]
MLYRTTYLSTICFISWSTLFVIDSILLGKHQAHKLVDNKQLSKPFNQSDKKTFLLDTYARIVATNNRRCPKRLRDLAKPKRQTCSDRNGDSMNFDLNWHTGNAAKAKRSSENSKMKELR